MWTTIQSVKTDHPEFLEVSRGLLESSSRKIILATTIICVAMLLAVGGVESGSLSINVMLIILSLGLVCAAAYFLLSLWMIGAQLIWLAGLSGVITLALATFKIKEIAFLFALIPLMAVATVGWITGVGFGALVIGLMAVVNTWEGGLFLSGIYFAMVGFAQVLAGFIGWSVVSPLLEMLEWTNFSYHMARDHLEEARDQRLELKQVEEDLILANNELARLANSLKVMTERAEEARRVKEEFVANVSHELRTPLNMIIGYANLIIKSPEAYGKRIPTRLLADIASIQRNSQHLVELVNDVLDLSQVDAGRLALSRQWTSARDIVSSAVLAVQPLFLSKKLTLDTEFPPEDLQIYCDSTRIREVILNLLSNAGRFTETGGVVVKASREGKNLIVSVNDTGPGIPQADQQRIFEPFQQLDPLLHHRTGGSGLGLAISKRFVEMHDGKMWIESEVGRGTNLLFSIPIEPGESAERTVGAARWINPFGDHTYDVRSRPFRAPQPEFIPRFVVVEPEENLGRLLTRYLDQVEFFSVRSMEDALTAIENSTAHALVVNERSSPNGNFAGLPMPFSTPVIQCWIPGREESTRGLGVIQYLIKPIDPDQLISALDEIKTGDMTLLMVDDDTETLQLFARIISISRPSIRVVRALNGREALQLMRERQPDVVLLDLILPELNGFQVLEEKERDSTIKSIPVIIISSTDPAGLPIISNQFSVYRSNGLSVKEFLDCLLTVSEILNSSPQKSRPGPPGNVLG